MDLNVQTGAFSALSVYFPQLGITTLALGITTVFQTWKQGQFQMHTMILH